MTSTVSGWRVRIRMGTSLCLAGLLCNLGFVAPLEAKGKSSPAKAANTRVLERKASAKAADPPEAGRAIRVKVRVVDVAGRHAFIEPGAAENLRVGDTVKLGKVNFKIVAVTASSAAIELGDQPLALGTRGVAESIENRPLEVAKKLPEPTKLSAFKADWQAVSPPAESQTPKPVPLGVSEDRSRNRLLFSAAGYAVFPQDVPGARFVSAELRARVHVEPVSSLPLAFDADVAGFFVEPQGRIGARRLVRLRELAASYGMDSSFQGALGRLRYASSILGNLDGVRIDAPLGSNFSLGAFGGLMPAPETGTFSTDVARFGSEVIWQNHLASWQPRLALGAHASQFGGSLDERKAYALVDLLPPFGRLGAHAELSFFDSDNVWNAPAVDLTGAGVDASVRQGLFFFGGHADFSRPERSRYIASFLPPEWLCRTSPNLGAADSCIGNDATYGGGVHAGLRTTKVSITVGGETSRTRNADASNTGGFTALRWLDFYDHLRLDLGASRTSGSLLRATTLSVAPGYTFKNADIDLSLRYNPSFTRYVTDASPFVQHALGTTLWFSPSRSLNLTLDGELDRGRDYNAIIIQTVAVWRPGL